MERPSIPFSTLKPLYERHKEEYDEAALCTLTTRNGTFVFAQKFFLRLGGLA